MRAGNIWKRLKKNNRMANGSKLLKIIMYVLGGLVGFYALLGFIVVPLAMKWAIASKGSEALQHPVRVSSVSFNPFVGRLIMKEFTILEKEGQMAIIGFKNLDVDVSLLDLFKKIYHVESLRLEGFMAAAVLKPDGRLNIMDLVPRPEADAAPSVDVNTADPAATSAGKSNAVSAEEKPLPMFIVDNLTIEGAQIRFTDQRVTPNFYTDLRDVRIIMTGFSTAADNQTAVLLQAKWDEKGMLAADVKAKLFVKPVDVDASLTLNNYQLTVATPYTGKYAGREVKGGKMNFKTTYRISANKIAANHNLLIQQFKFGNTVDSKEVLGLPFGLVIALLEDPHGRINISLPVNGDMSQPQFNFVQLLGSVTRNFFMKIVTKPFSVLGSFLPDAAEGETDELGFVRFLPGATELSDAEKQKLSAVIKGLWEHPRLLLTVNGGYDPAADWEAIKTQAFIKDYDALMKESNNSDEGWTLQHLYQRRFGIRALWALSRTHKTRMGQYNDIELNAALRRQLIEDAPVDKSAVEELAMARAHAVHDFILASGFDKSRLMLGQARPATTAGGMVPLELTLTTLE